MTTAVAIEQYITVAQGIIARRSCTKDIAKWTVIILILPAFLINFSYYFYRCVSDNEYVPKLPIYTYFGNSQGFIVYSWVRMMINKYIPILIVIVFNILLLALVCKSRRRDLKENQNRNHNLTGCSMMLSAVTITFILCHFLEAFTHMELYSSFFGECSIYTMTFHDFEMVVKVLECA